MKNYFSFWEDLAEELMNQNTDKLDFTKKEDVEKEVRWKKHVENHADHGIRGRFPRGVDFEQIDVDQENEHDGSERRKVCNHLNQIIPYNAEIAFDEVFPLKKFLQDRKGV